MIWFAIIAALLIAVALAWILLPLLRGRQAQARVSRGAVNVGIYRDQLSELDADLAAGTLSRDRHEEARREIERHLLDDAGETEATAPGAARGGLLAAVVIAAVVPIAAIGLYLAVGNPDGLAPERVARPDDAHSVTPQQVEVMVARLAARLQADPNDVDGWVMLARSYVVLERFKEASTAYAMAVQRVPDSAQLLVDYADTLAMAQGRNLLGEPEKLIRRALAIDPNNLKALALGGTVAFQKKQYAAAVSHWQRMLNLVPPDSETARAVQGSIAEAQSLGGLAPGPGAGAGKTPRAAAAKGARVRGSVKLAPALADRVGPNDVVFIFARAAEGPRIPLAVLRKRVADLPAKFELDDSMAMAPGMNLSGFERVVVGARISKNGNPVAQAGDLEGLSAPVKTGAAGVAVVIDKVIQ